MTNNEVYCIYKHETVPLACSRKSDTLAWQQINAILVLLYLT